MRVLEAGEDLVADVFVERHATPEGAALGHHARAEYGAGLARDERGEQIGELFRGVLAIAMDEGDEVESVVDGVAVAELLVAAVALVEGGAEDGDPEAFDGFLVSEAGGEGVVFRGVVDDEDFDVAAAQLLGDAAQYAADGFFGIVGDDEDENSLFGQVEAHRAGAPEPGPPWDKGSRTQARGSDAYENASPVPDGAVFGRGGRGAGRIPKKSITLQA